MASTATQPTPAPRDDSSEEPSEQRVTAREWFASGARRPYDPIAKTLLETARSEGSSQQLHAFEKVVATPPVGADTRWPTMLPDRPDGSCGYAQVDRYLGPEPRPRLYVEYLGPATPTSRGASVTRRSHHPPPPSPKSPGGSV